VETHEWRRCAAMATMRQRYARFPPAARRPRRYWLPQNFAFMPPAPKVGAAQVLQVRCLRYAVCGRWERWAGAVWWWCVRCVGAMSHHRMAALLARYFGVDIALIHLQQAMPAWRRNRLRAGNREVCLWCAAAR